MAPVLMLVGFMGSGKTDVGRRVARRLDWDFVDLDAAVERRAGRSIPDIFAQEGEATFRRLEVEVLQALLSGEGERGRVIALGGGTPTTPQAQHLLGEPSGRSRLVIYLEVDPRGAWQRVAGSARPLARSRSDFLDLARRRLPLYEAVADERVSADRPARAVADDVVAAAQRRLLGRVGG